MPAATIPEANSFTPVRVLELNLEERLPSVAAPSAESPHRRLLALIRLHDEPLGALNIDIPRSGLTNEELAQAVWTECGEAIRMHLRGDGLPEVDHLAPEGVSTGGDVSACDRQRQQFLRDAPELTVLIPSRERPDRLRTCVESILDCAYPADRFEVVVADNAPTTERTHDVVEELARESGGRVRYVREDAPGSASARNRGLTLVQGEFVAMTDDDVVVDRNWLTEIARAFTAYPGAGAVSGLLWPMELETPAQVWFEQYGGFSRGFERRVFDLQSHRPSGEPLYPWNAGLFGTGNNFSFRTSVLRDIGGFDPALGNGTPALGGVDSEVLLRTILCGHQIVYEPRAIAHHAHRPEYEALRRQVYGYGAGLVAYYLKTVLAEPRFALDFARKVPTGIRWMLSADAHINKHKLEDYPAELTWTERKGMLYGPLAYARSRRRYGPHPVYGKRR
jgi:glycosyltransferase involved in cell wall biosynthesis